MLSLSKHGLRQAQGHNEVDARMRLTRLELSGRTNRAPATFQAVNAKRQPKESSVKRLFGLLLMCGMTVATVAPVLADQQEQQIGQQVYQQLSQKGEIETQSPYYSILTPIARRISAVANPQYDAPFHFIIVREKQPNAFAVPGGNVYVTEPMFTFAKNKEELAGVLCHETSHTIHHDVVTLARKQQGVDLVANVLSSLLGGGNITNFILGTGDTLFGLHFSRGVERNADLKGAHTCAQAGYNPWGMVWLFEQFENNPTAAPPEALSDHPRDDHRISDLENLFKSEPQTFGRFNSDVSTATPLNARDTRAASVHRKASRSRKATAYCCGPRH